MAVHRSPGTASLHQPRRPPVSPTGAVPWLLASYLLGAIPTSYLAARMFRGIDLREHGSRNLGATNLYRVLGWRFAIPVGLFDAAKGAIPVLLSATAYELWKERAAIAQFDAAPLVLSCIVSFVSALLAVKFLIRFVSRHSFAAFAWYRIVFGGIILVTSYTGLVRW